MQEMQVQFLGREDSLEEKLATHASILTWEIPWVEETDRLQSTGLQRVRQDLATKQQQQRHWIWEIFLKFKSILRNNSGIGVPGRALIGSV